MNLLVDQWIPVRPPHPGGSEKISLRTLLCNTDEWKLCLPRDDMELAALQLLICLVQVLLTPNNTVALKRRIAKPLTDDEYDGAVELYSDWFRLDHPTHPFMQVRGVAAGETTQMDKLLVGLTGATNSCFVNQPGQGDRLCGGCTAIALFNQASCAPSFGGGFKAGLRGSAPVTTLVQGPHLRQTVWLNVLNEDFLGNQMTWYGKTKDQKPTWCDPIKAGDTITASQIGMARGLLWQPAHIELMPPRGPSVCSCCGAQAAEIYTDFKKAKFSFTIMGTWPHPHSPRIMTDKKGTIDEKFVAFTTDAPSWTQLGRFVVRRELNDVNEEGQQPSAVVLQVRQLYGENAEKLHLLVGGYRNNQASILERRHEVFTLNHGWDSHIDAVNEMVKLGIGYRDALYKSLWLFAVGMKEAKGDKSKRFKGAGITIYNGAKARYYRRTEPLIQRTLDGMNFSNPGPDLETMQATLKQITTDLFLEQVKPYRQDPELIKTMAFAKRTLYKHMRNLEPQQDKGGNDGKTPIA